MVEKSGLSYHNVRLMLIRKNLPFKRLRKSYKDTYARWYDANLTLPEMVKKSGLSYATVKGILKIRKLPFKKISECIPEWYDASLTIDEMSEKANKCYSTVYSIITSKKLPYRNRASDRIKFPEWYDPTLSMRQMAMKAGLSRERIRQILNERGLMAEYLSAHNSELEKQKNAEIDTIKRAYKPGMHISDLVRILKTSEPTLRRKIKEYNIPGIIKDKDMPSFDDLSWWYDEDLTIDEMAEKAGVKSSTIRGAVLHRKLPYKRVRIVYLSELSWYDSNKTVAEMSDETGMLRANISNLLRSRGLPYKHADRKVDITDWYNANFTVKEMSDKSGKSVNSIKKILASRHLPYKRKRK